MKLFRKKRTLVRGRTGMIIEGFCVTD